MISISISVIALLISIYCYYKTIPKKQQLIRTSKEYQDILESMISEKERTGTSDIKLINKHKTTIATLVKHATPEQLDRWIKTKRKI